MSWSLRDHSFRQTSGCNGTSGFITSQIFTNILLCTPPDSHSFCGCERTMEQEVWHPVSLLPLDKSFNLIGWSECVLVHSNMNMIGWKEGALLVSF